MKKIIFIPLFSIIVLLLLGVIEAKGVALFWISFFSILIFCTAVKALQKLMFVWENINFQISCNPEYFKADRDIMNHCSKYLKTTTDKRLPVTETDCQSHFTATPEIEHFRIPTDFIKTRLTEASKSKAWKACKKSKQQAQQFLLF